MNDNKKIRYQCLELLENGMKPEAVLIAHESMLRMLIAKEITSK